MGKTYAGNTSDESVIPKKIYGGDASNHSVPCKVAYCGDGNGKSVEVYRNTSLPSAYQKVQYIYDTNGTEYINTGVKPNSDTRLFIDLQIMVQTTTGEGFLGCAQNGANNYAYIAGGNPSRIVYYWGGNNGGISMSTARHKFDVNQNYHGRTYIDDTAIMNSASTFSTVANDYLLFAYMEAQTIKISKYIKYRLYSFSVWQNKSMIRDMYPCYLKSDSQVIGMYDLIGNQFYGNDGTGIFYKGPDVN